MDSSKILREAVDRAQKEIKELMAEVKAGQLDQDKLHAKLTEVESGLKVLDWHLDRNGKGT